MKEDFTNFYIKDTISILKKIDKKNINDLVNLLINLKKKKGRIFFLGVGGSAANASHAVNDFRKILEIESYTPIDNVAELTAIANDEGWDFTFTNWLKGSNVKSKDLIFVFSVGGGNVKNNVSNNIVEALKFAKNKKLKIVGVVGRDGGYTKKVADVCIQIPVIDKNLITPHTEGLQAVIWHLLVSHPKLKINQTKWESLKTKKY